MINKMNPMSLFHLAVQNMENANVDNHTGHTFHQQSTDNLGQYGQQF